MAVFVGLERSAADKLTALRRPGESFNVILRLVEIEAKGLR
jgi:hypothetical protein